MLTWFRPTDFDVPLFLALPKMTDLSVEKILRSDGMLSVNGKLERINLKAARKIKCYQRTSWLIKESAAPTSPPLPLNAQIKRLQKLMFHL